MPPPDVVHEDDEWSEDESERDAGLSASDEDADDPVAQAPYLSEGEAVSEVESQSETDDSLSNSASWRIKRFRLGSRNPGSSQGEENGDNENVWDDWEVRDSDQSSFHLKTH
jgi:hypothetical protein